LLAPGGGLLVRGEVDAHFVVLSLIRRGNPQRIRNLAAAFCSSGIRDHQPCRFHAGLALDQFRAAEFTQTEPARDHSRGLFDGFGDFRVFAKQLWQIADRVYS
jgi:hypothetical protein